MRQRARVLLYAILLCFGIYAHTVYTKAESATVNFETDQKEAAKGSEITVTVKITADTDTSELEGYIYYSSEVLEFVKGGSCINGGDGVLRLYDPQASDASTGRKYILTFTAKKVGISDIHFKEKPIIYSLDGSSELSVSTNRISVQVVAGKNKSNNTKLKSLKINPGKLEPKFDTEVLKYAVTVPKGTKKVTVSGIAQDSNADVYVNGNDNLTDGENTVTLTVEAENGDTRDYIINVTRVPKKDGESDDDTKEEPEQTKEPESELEEPESESEEITYTENGLQVSKEGDTIYLQNSYRYELAELEDDSLIPEGYMKTQLILYGTHTTAYVKKDNVQDEFLLIYAVSMDGEKTFYQYDMLEKTFQRYSQPIISSNNANANLLGADKYQEKVNQLSLIIAILCAIAVLLLLIVIWQFMKSRGYKDDLD